MKSPDHESKKTNRESRKEQILQSLATILEESPYDAENKLLRA